MISSNEVSQMVMAQQSMFAQQANFAESIGPRMSGMDANAVFSGAQRHAGHHSPVSSHSFPPVSYAPSGISGYGAGNRLGNMAMGGMSAAASVGGMALGFSGLMAGKAGILGGLGTIGMHAFDPIGAGIAGYGGAGLGGLVGGGIAGAALGAAAPLAIMYAGSKAADAYFGGARQQSMINTTLAQNFGFINQNSRTGFGFNRQQSYEIGRGMRGLAHDADLMTNVEEMSSLLPQLRATGEFAGVKDATEFKKRFSESIKTLREISKVIGSTMEEAAEMFAHSKRTGFLGRTEQMKNMMNIQYTSAVTGMSNGQVMQMQQAGSDMATQMGFRRVVGASAVTNIAQRLGTAVNAGTITADQIQDITGIAGQEGEAALAQRFTGMAYQMGMGTSVGRLAMAGLADFDESGKFVGMNKDLARKFREGSLSVEGLKSLGRKNMANRRNQVGFKAREEEIAGQFASIGGLEGVAKLLENIASDRYGGMGDEAVTLLGKKFNIGSQEMDILRKMGAGGGVTADLEKSEFARSQSSRAAYNEATDPSKAWERFKIKMGAKLFGGLEEAGAKMQKDIATAFDEFVDDAMSRHVVVASERARDVMNRAFSGDSKASAELREAADALSQGVASGQGHSRGIGTSMVRGAFYMGTLGARISSYLGAGGFLWDSNKKFDKAEDSVADFLSPLTAPINDLSARYTMTGGLTAYGQAVDAAGMLDLNGEVTGQMDSAELARGLRKLDTFSLKSEGGQKMVARAQELLQEELGGKDFNDLSMEKKREIFKAVQSTLSSEMGGYRSGSREMQEMKEELHSQGIGQRYMRGGFDQDVAYFDDAEASALTMRALQQGGALFQGSDIADSGALNYDIVTTAKNMGIKARQGLKDAGFSDEVEGFLKNSPKASRVAAAITSNPKVAAALRGSTALGVKRELEKLGYKVSMDDAKGLMKMGAELAAGDASKKVEALKEFSRADLAGGVAAAISNVHNVGNAMLESVSGMALPADIKQAVEGLGDQMSGVGAAGQTGAEMESGLMASRQGIIDLAHRISGNKGLSREARDALAGSNNVLKSLLSADERINNLSKRKQGFKDEAELAKEFGVSEEDVKGIVGRRLDPSSPLKLSADQTRKLRGLVENRIAGHIEGKEAMAGAEKPKTMDNLDASLGRLDETMRGVKTTGQITNSLLASIATYSEVSDVVKGKVAEGTAEATKPPPEKP